MGEAIYSKYRELKNWLTAEVKSNAPEVTSTLQQKRMTREIVNEASTMDVKLQREVESIVDNPDVRVAYLGEEFRNVELTREQALGVAIVGPREESLRLFDANNKPITPEEWLAERKRIDADYEARVIAEKERQLTAKEAAAKTEQDALAVREKEVAEAKKLWRSKQTRYANRRRARQRPSKNNTH
jgi:hypothetical protein